MSNEVHHWQRCLWWLSSVLYYLKETPRKTVIRCYWSLMMLTFIFCSDMHLSALCIFLNISDTEVYLLPSNAYSILILLIPLFVTIACCISLLTCHWYSHRVLNIGSSFLVLLSLILLPAGWSLTGFGYHLSHILFNDHCIYHTTFY